MASAETGTPAETKKNSVFHRLYVGTGAFDIVGKRKRWYLFFGALVLVCLASIGIRGFNFGIEFEGGTQIQLPSVGTHGTITPDEAKQVFADTLGKQAASAQTVGVGNSATVQLRAESLPETDVMKVKQALFDKLQPMGSNGQTSLQTISDSAVSASWGGEISRQALIALGVFMVLVTIFLTFYFERWMALAALVSLIHDIIVTAGIYSLVGFEVTPATVIGLLTILAFSLYDTVVVFDKVKENSRGLLGLTRRTYAETANLALNQTLMRSINTSIIALLPVIGLLVVGYLLLGSGTLQDLALVQLTGMLVGVLSSLFLATPLLVDLKMRDPRYQQQAQRVQARRANQARKSAERDATGGTDEDFDASDDEALEAELRKEKAYAAAASVPARNPKAAPRRGRPAGKRKR
ncbi:protein translocase subunit SecF [Amycolatopsis rhizosphaerae]|uniref:Protein-export membrane protein SecF n=1 Tax=Amycolatopsis rhizosphaerae TaxID=2053003 RepID=A0A558CEP2_9PSEU|nr:protein translocase subunit SecF [Amycolatopsis rhizosphaerae]TVT47132.1 protein translocase subunit SecF [Amycolatopsis rhizosphaerae]